MPHPEFELAYLYIDLGKPFYRMAVPLMATSAHAVMPNARIVQMSPRHTTVWPQAHATVTSDLEANIDSICQVKGLMFAERAAQTDLPTLLCDVDLVWNHSPQAVFKREFDVAVMWRPENSLQPYNSGVIFTKPTDRARSFWMAYGRCMNELPPSLAQWYGDQIALASLIGPSAPGNTPVRSGARVLILDMDEIARAPVAMPDKPMSSYATHFKGKMRREWMGPYAQMVLARKEAA